MTATKFFYIDNNINKVKERTLLQKAFQLRLYKNYISEELYKEVITSYNLDELSLYDFIKTITKLDIPFLTKKDMEYAVKQVYSNYTNKIKNIQNKKLFKKIQRKAIYYQKTKKDRNGNIIYKPGDLKNVKITQKDTALTTVLNYMLKNRSESKKEWREKIEWVLENKDLDEGIRLFYRQIAYYLEKFQDRLIKLVKAKKRLINKKFWKQRIDIKSLSYKTQSRIKKEIVAINENRRSVINGFLILGGYDYEKKIGQKTKKGELAVAVKLSSKYHFKTEKSLKDIEDSSYFSKVYNVTFDSFGKLQRIDLTSEEPELHKVFDFSQNKHYVGGDLNAKHNLFYLSTDDVYGVDKKTMEKYILFIKNYDKKKNKKIDTDRKKRQRERIQRSLEADINRTVSRMFDDMSEKNLDHLILEDLSLSGKRFRVKNEEYDIGYGRFFSFINATTLKNRIREMGHKRGISVSFVPAEYTSQRCNKCHYISKQNRKTQEEFECVACGHKDNADHNSSKNIRDIILLDVLRENFLSFDKSFSEYNVKSFLSHQEVKNFYHSLDISR